MTHGTPNVTSEVVAFVVSYRTANLPLIQHAGSLIVLRYNDARAQVKLNLRRE